MRRLIMVSWACFAFFSLINAQNKKPLDGEATPMTRALFYNLDKISGEHILFGHQNATSYGHSWKNEEGRSDVKDVVGAHPAVIGADFGGLTSADEASVKKSMDGLRKTLQDTYQWGGLVTICWHSNNPVNDGTFYYDKNPIAAVPRILPGGDYHEK